MNKSRPTSARNHLSGSGLTFTDEIHRTSAPISRDDMDRIFLGVGQKLREGLSSEAEKLLVSTLENYDHSPDNFANLKRLLSFTLETMGRYKESLETVKPFEDEENLGPLRIDTQIMVTTQLAIAYNNLTDQPKAVTLLKESLQKANEHELFHLSGSIKIALARVYRKLNEFTIAREFAEKSLVRFREHGNWLGMAEAYREIALSYHQEGNSEKSLDHFLLGIKIIGGHSAPFMLGKLYTDMSGAYWFLRRPQEGIACLEKSIEFFDRTEHILNSVIAYNNLGINLMLIGEWTRAEEMIKRALDLALKNNHTHTAGILDSLGELKILRGDYAEAEKLLGQAVSLAKERKSEWYTVQSMRNLARCLLAKGDAAGAAQMARETMTLCSQIGDKHYANMAGLIRAEALAAQGQMVEAEHALEVIEETDPSSDFFVLGSIQRIRGIIALGTDDRELAIHHFQRSLTIFEAAEDLYHIAFVHYLIGVNLDGDQSRKAMEHLTSAVAIFRKLGVADLTEAAERRIAELSTHVEDAGPKRKTKAPQSAASQLLMVRLAEATASRELLFRELMAVLQQESRAKKIIIAEPDESNDLRAFITHGYTPAESRDLTAKLSEARKSGAEPATALGKGVAVMQMRSASAPHAYLMIQPAAGAAMTDGSSLLPLLRVVELGMDVIALREREKSPPVEQETHRFATNTILPGFIHSSPAMAALVEEIYKIRSSDVTVLVTGESGTGKELVSRAIHTLSNRKDEVFVPFNCTAVPKELAEGHLFGYKKGSFTGAVTDSPGMIRAADGGTLFLDEVGDLPLDVQPKLLRFLQEGEVQPIGEKTPVKVDVRVIAATNMPLEEKVAEGTFREDLFYRLNVIRLRVPPLRERRSEIPPIINYYIDHYSARFGKHDVTFTPQTVDLLMVCDWEGNVRQLCNEIQRIIARAVDNEVITPDHLSPELRRSAKPLTTFAGAGGQKPIATFDTVVSNFRPVAPKGSLDEAVAELEINMIRSSLARHGWNISKAARELGLTRRGLYLKLGRYGIEKAA